MVGKQAQRTKGNVKPSSSARAAELLTSSGKSGPGLGFVGFGTMTGDPGYVPAAAGTEDADNNMDADFRIVLRKLSKRDSTTKLKALQEFSTLCQDKDPEQIRSVLLFWPRIYNKAAIDHDRRVREATQQAFEQLVLRVRRSLAPHLKGLMGAWLVAQSDTYAPAATAARSAFQAAFPPAKQTEALVFCKEEILTHLHENLFLHTAQTLSDIKTAEPEDMEARFHRVLCASLNALKTFLGVIPVQSQSPLIEKYKTMLSDNKFWKYAKHSQAMIQGSFYSVISAFCQHQPDLAREFSARMSPVVFHNLDNTDPLVCGTLWEAVLYLISTIHDSWKHVSARKGMLPGLWRMLREGGAGSATVIYPSLLPFISHLPAEVIGEDTTHFYMELFTSIKAGLSNEKVIASPSEYNAVVCAFMECLHFVISQYLTDTSLMEVLIQNQLIPLLRSSILDNSAALSASPLYPMTVDLLTYLHKTSSNEEPEKSSNQEPEKSSAASSILSEILRSFHELDIFNLKNDKAMERYAALLCTFKGKIPETQAKGARVKFADETPPQPKFESVALTSMLIKENGPILPIVITACCDAYKLSLSTKTVAPLVFFSHLIKTYASEHVVNAVWTDSNVKILEEYINPWIKEYDDSIQDPKISKSFVDIILVLFDSGTVEGKPQFLTKAMECIPSFTVFQAFIETVHQQNTNKSVHVWFKGEAFGNKIVEITRTLCQQSLGDHGNTQEAQWDMLGLAFSSNKNLEPIIGEEYLSEILREILCALPSSESMATLSQVQVERCVAFVCDVTNNFFSNVKGCLLLQPAEELVFSILQFSCQQDFIKSDAMNKKLMSTWQQGLRALIAQQEGLTSDSGFLHKVARHLKTCVRNDGKSFDRLQNLVSIATSLVRIADDYFAQLSPERALTHPSVLALLQEMYIPLEHNKTPQWQTSVMVGHDLSLDVIPEDLLDSSPPQAIPESIASTAYTVQVFFATVNDRVTPEISLNASDIDVVLMALHATALTSCLVTPRIKTHAKTDLARVHKLLVNKVSNFLNNMSVSAITDILNKAINRSMGEGSLWALGLKKLLLHIKKKSHTIDILATAGGLDRFSILTASSLHTLQALIPYIPDDAREQLLDIQAASILSYTPDRCINASGFRQCLCIMSQILTSPNDGPVRAGSAPGQVLVSVLDHVQQIRQEQEHMFLFDSHVREESWVDVSLNIEVMIYMKLLVHQCPTQLTDQAWDFILCSLVSWVQSCGESRQDFTSDPKSQAFGIATFDLLTKVGLCLDRILPEDRASFPSNLGTEWSEFFSDGIYSLVLPVFIHLAGSMERVPTVGYSGLLRSLASAVSHCPQEHINKHKLPAKLIAGDDSNLPQEQQTILNHLSPMLLNPNRAIQITAYQLLLRIMPDLCQFDEKIEQSEEEDKPARSPPFAVMSVLCSAGDAVDLLLHDVTVGEPVVMETHGDEHIVTMAYLLSWKLVLAFFRASKVELRAEYSQFMRNHSLVDRLMDVLYKLMPENPLIQQDIVPGDTQEPKLNRNMFTVEPSLNVMDTREQTEVAHMACFVYCHVLTDLPAILRHWYNGLDKYMSDVANRYTSKYASPILVNEEISAVQQTDVSLHNMTIKTRPAAREVAATYTVEEVSMELVVTLPSNHPLGQITVDCGKRIGVATTQWRNWMLQLTTFLHRQNGSILDGLTLWCRNVDKRFEGVEECMICFSVIHGSNCQLPKLLCKTCKKRFHSACLYKWFNTSNNSTCPMCRNLF